MSQRNDPFATPEPGFEPWEGPLNSDAEFAQPHVSMTGVLRRFVEAEIAAHPNKSPQTVVRFVETPHGPELRIEQGDLVRVFTGPRDELAKIARAKGAI